MVVLFAFHDIQCKLHDKGVPHFIEDLKEGRIDGKIYKVNKIIHTQHLGIGWIQKENDDEFFKDKKVVA